MKIALARLGDFSLQAQDGEIGSVHDVLFEDDLWLMRYLVADTGGFLFGRKVLLAPAALLQPQAGDTAVPVCLTRDEVMAVGDNFNDVEMLEFAGLPVVMGNAVEELKSRGWHVTAHQDEAGVAQAIDRFVLRR